MIVLELTSKDLGRINSVDLLVSKYYRTSLYEFCKKYHYDSLFVEIIKQVTNDYAYEKVGYKEIELPDELDDRYYEVEKKFSYGVDNRSVAERVVSLGVNWIVEDVIVHKSSSVFILTGCDNARDLLANPITSTPDIRYVGEGESFYVEVCSDFTKFMSRANRYDIRKLKYMKLEDLMLIDRVKTVLLFIDVVNKTFYRIPFKSQPYTQQDKYSKNTVTFEFDEGVKFLSLDVLFENCRKRQPNPSLYSNFNTECEVKKTRKWVDEKEDPAYWDSLYNSEPTFIRSRIPSQEEIDEYMGNTKFMSVDDIDAMDLGVQFVELPEGTYNPFEDGDEPPEKEYFDTSDNPFVEDFAGDANPFTGEGLPF